MYIGFIKPVSVPRDPKDREPDEPINLYFDDDFPLKSLAPEYKEIPCANSIDEFVFFLEATNIPYRVIVTSKPDFALFQFMFRTNQIYPLSVGDSKLNIVRENTEGGMLISQYLNSDYGDGTSDFFDDSEFYLYECEKKIDADGDISYGNDNGKISALLIQYELTLYGIASNYIHAHFTHDELMQFDRSNGILFSVDSEGQLCHKIVSGTDRPDMSCVVFNDDGPAIEKCRPYYEDSELGKSLDSALGIGRTFPFFMDDEDDEFGSPQDLDVVTELAEDGNLEMMGMLMQAYIYGSDELGVEEDPEKACYWMRKLAEEGEPVGSFNLGVHYAKGYGVPRDFEQAVYWMEQAAEQGDEDAPHAAENYRRIQKLLVSAEAGDTQAQADLAAAFVGLGGSLNEAGPEKDYEEAFKWSQKSAENGNLDGVYALALCYDRGRGTEEDAEKGYELFKKAAEAGHAPSQWNLACAYLTGRGVEENNEEAWAWAMKSAEQGNAFAVAGIGHMYEEGRGVEPDIDKAIEWYEKALEIEPENVQVQHAVALAYMDMDTDPEAMAKALYWFKKAADNGDAMCGKQYLLWSYVTKNNGGIIPPEFNLGSYIPEIMEKADNGDLEAQEVVMKCFR